VLHARYEMRRINHSVAFSKDGACTNQAESYFSRLRRAEIGQHHHVSGKYLAAYAVEMAWREDNRRVHNGALHQTATGAALAHRVSRVWRASGSVGHSCCGGLSRLISIVVGQPRIPALEQRPQRAIERPRSGLQ
jgi:hypothetical protein